MRGRVFELFEPLLHVIFIAVVIVSSRFAVGVEYLTNSSGSEFK